MGFCNNLKLLLHDRNLKQVDLCRKTGIQTSLMSAYIGGKKSPTIGNAILIADALDISLDTLVGKNAYPTQEKQQSSKILTELYEIAKSLSVEEQLYLLDTVKALKQHLSRDLK